MNTFFSEIQKVAAEPTPRKDPATVATGSAAEQTYVPEEDKDKAKATVQPDKTSTDPPAHDPAAASTPATVSKMSKEDAIAAGKGSAHLIADGIETVLNVAELFRFVFSMSPEQKQRLELLQTKSPDKWTEEDKFVMQIFLKQQTKHEKIKNNVAFKPTDVSNMAESMAVYHEISGKKMSPEVIIFSTIGKHLASKLTDMFL